MKRKLRADPEATMRCNFDTGIKVAKLLEMVKKKPSNPEGNPNLKGRSTNVAATYSSKFGRKAPEDTQRQGKLKFQRTDTPANTYKQRVCQEL